MLLIWLKKLFYYWTTKGFYHYRVLNLVKLQSSATFAQL